MPDFDPFGGGGNYENKSVKKDNTNLMEMIKKIIIIVIVLAVIGGLIYFLFFNTTEISFTVKNTEKKNVIAQINITEVGKTKTTTISSDETIKLNKSKNYTYKITAKDYAPIKSTSINFEDPEISVILTKDIKLNITTFTCPTTVYLGQTIKCELQLKNVSGSQDYNVDNLIFEGDIISWPDFANKTYSFVDISNEPLSGARKRITAQETITTFISFTIPTDKKYLKNQKIIARVEYTNNKKDTNFLVAETPIITFSSTISSTTEMTSGTEISKTYTIDNSKNKTDLSDLKISIDANYIPTVDANYSFDTNQIFKLNSQYLSVDPSDKTQGTITIQIPNNLKSGKIVGKLYLDSPMFAEPKEISFTINIKEPNNDFIITLSKQTETINYDANLGNTTIKTIDLKLDNKNLVPVHIDNITIENSTGTTDCNNWIIIPTIYNNYNIQPKDNQTAIIQLKGIDLTGLTSVTGTKICALKIKYAHPFTEETITVLRNIIINVE
ncbi:MAG: hypothetical protein WCX82_03660 [archaeon]|jgi:hypothetical protein